MQRLKSTPQNEDPVISPGQAKPSINPPEWPQPHGLFTDQGGNIGITFNPYVCFKELEPTYKKLVIDQSCTDITLEQVAFTTLLARRTIRDDDGAVLFKLFDIRNIPEVPQELIVIRKNNKFLRISCLEAPQSEQGAGPAV